MKRPSGCNIILPVIILACPFFFLGAPAGYDGRSFKAAWDLGHVVFFTLASICIFEAYDRRVLSQKAVSVFLQVSVIVFCSGLLIEYLQKFVHGRSPDIFDLMRNQLGVLIGFVFFSTVCTRLGPVILRGLQVGTLLVLLFFLRPLASAVVDERMAAARFPLLSDFETSLEIKRWQDTRQLARVDNPVRHGSGALRVQLSTKKFSGTSLVYFPHDWSGYDWLNFSVYNPTDAELVLHARVHDRQHKSHDLAFDDRFHCQFSLHPGWNDLRVSLEEVRHSPAGREMVMHEIEGFGIFVIKQPRPLIIYLDYVYLNR